MFSPILTNKIFKTRVHSERTHAVVFRRSNQTGTAPTTQAAKSGSTEGGWTLLNERGGVTVWKKAVTGSRIFAFRGFKRLNAPIEKVAWVLLNNDVMRRKRWIDMLDEFWVIEQPSSQSVVAYGSYAMPFPFEDRDIVVQADQSVDSHKRQVTLDVYSVEHPVCPPEETVGIRAKLYFSRFILTKVSSLETNVVCEIHIDPMGLLPDWLLNFINRMWPVNTLSKLEVEAQRADTECDPFTEATLAAAS